jgi:hypothetical protein
MSDLIVKNIERPKDVVEPGDIKPIELYTRDELESALYSVRYLFEDAFYDDFLHKQLITNTGMPMGVISLAVERWFKLKD